MKIYDNMLKLIFLSFQDTNEINAGGLVKYKNVHARLEKIR